MVDDGRGSSLQVVVRTLANAKVVVNTAADACADELAVCAAASAAMISRDGGGVDVDLLLPFAPHHRVPGATRVSDMKLARPGEDLLLVRRMPPVPQGQAPLLGRLALPPRPKCTPPALVPDIKGAGGETNEAVPWPATASVPATIGDVPNCEARSGAMTQQPRSSPCSCSPIASMKSRHDSLPRAEIAASLDKAVLDCAAICRQRFHGRACDGIYNRDVAVVFLKKMESLFEVLGPACAVPLIVYHWTRRENICSISKNGLLLPGQLTSDGSHIKKANGARFGEGIYTATDIESGRAYTSGSQSALLCLGVPGKSCDGRSWHGRRNHNGRASIEGSDSLQNGSTIVFRNASQIVPLFLVCPQSDAILRSAAEAIIAALQRRLMQAQSRVELAGA